MHAHRTEPRLTLKSQLQDLALVLPWLESLTQEFTIPPDTQFAISLCLEEALSNVIRHGYAGQPNQNITVDCSCSGEWLIFVIEDAAPPFTPFAPASSPPATDPAFSASIQDIEPGGNGIALMKRFAGSLAWEPLPDGNRLKLGFHIPPSAPITA